MPIYVCFILIYSRRYREQKHSLIKHDIISIDAVELSNLMLI